MVEASATAAIVGYHALRAIPSDAAFTFASSHATRVAGFKTWLALGYCVRRKGLV